MRCAWCGISLIRGGSLWADLFRLNSQFMYVCYGGCPQSEHYKFADPPSTLKRV